MQKSTKTWMIFLLIGLAITARVINFDSVFTTEGVLLQGNDANYHTLRSIRAVKDFPHVPHFDPFMNYPVGASILWPPLFDGLISGIAVAGYGYGAGDEDVATVAAIVPVALAVLTLPLVVLLALRLLGWRMAIWAGLFFAVLPLHVLFSRLGYADQHVLEAFWCSAILLLFVEATQAQKDKRMRYGIEALLGLCLALAFWTWMGSGLYLVMLAGYVSLLQIVVPRGKPEARQAAGCLARACSIASIVLVISLIAVGQPGKLMQFTIHGLTGFQVVVVAACALFAGGVWFSRRMLRLEGIVPRFLTLAGSILGASAIAFMLIPGLWQGLLPVLDALGKSNEFYRNNVEFDSLLFSGFDPLSVELERLVKRFGLTLLLVPLAARELMTARGRGLHRFHEHRFLLYIGAFFLALAFARQRFLLYLSIPYAIWMAAAFESLVAAASRWHILRWVQSRVGKAVLTLILLAPCAIWYSDNMHRPVDTEGAELRAALRWLRHAPTSTPPDRQAVFAEWDYGHVIQLFARKPVIASPFGSDGGAGAIQDSAHFFIAEDPAQVIEILERRRVANVLLTNPATEVFFSYGLVAPDGQRTVTLMRGSDGSRLSFGAGFWGLIVSRLYYFDGMVPRGFAGEALGTFRLLYEGAERDPSVGFETRKLKIYGFVPGVVLGVHAAPGQRVSARLAITTNQARRFDWVSTVVADTQGYTRILLPYATGKNGESIAGAYTVIAGSHREILRLSEAQVVQGARLFLNVYQVSDGADGQKQDDSTKSSDIGGTI